MDFADVVDTCRFRTLLAAVKVSLICDSYIWVFLVNAILKGHLLTRQGCRNIVTV
jgi:hypothetical protein